MRILTRITASSGLDVSSAGVDTITLGNSSNDKVIANAPITASSGISGSRADFALLFVNGTQITSSQEGGGGGISTVYTLGNIQGSGSSGDPIILRDTIIVSSVTASFSGSGVNITNITASNVKDLYSYTSGNSASIDNNVVALWRFNENSSSNALSDVSSSYYDLPLYGTAVTASGKFATTRQLSSAGLFHATGSEELGTLLNSNWSLDGWIKISQTPTSDGYVFLYSGLQYETDIAHIPLIDLRISDENRLVVNAWKNYGIETNISRQAISTDILSVDSWTHFAVVRTLNSASDGLETGSISNYKIFINGKLETESSNVYGSITYVSGTNTTHNLSVGSKIQNSVGTGSEYFNGYLDDLRLSNVTRSADEIKTLYLSSYPTINGLVKSGSAFSEENENIFYTKGNLTLGAEKGTHRLNVYGGLYTENLYVSGSSTIGSGSSDNLTINSTLTASSPVYFSNKVTMDGSSFTISSNNVNISTAIITASIISASNIYTNNEFIVVGNTIQVGIIENTGSYNFNDLITFSDTTASFESGIKTIIKNGSLSGSFSGSYIGTGAGLTFLTASNINNFTNDVRAQFTAGNNISIVNGVISSSASGGGLSSVLTSGSITGSGVLGNEVRLKDYVTINTLSASVISSSNFYIDQNSLITGELIQTDYIDAIEISASVISSSNFYIDQNTLITGELIQTDAIEVNTYLQLNPSDPLPSGSLGRLAVSGTVLYFHNGTSWSAIS